MKTHQTIAGNNYVVYSKNGGTVTDASGTLNKTVEAGDFLFIPAAPSDMLMCDDDESVIKQANFKRALAVLRLLGGGDNSGLPAGFRRVEYLETNGGTSILTDIPFSKNTGLKLKFIPFSNDLVSVLCHSSWGASGAVTFTANHKNYLRFSLTYVAYVPLREGGYVDTISKLGEGKTGCIIENELTVAELNWQGSGEWSANWGQEELRRPLPQGLMDGEYVELFAQANSNYFKGRLLCMEISEGAQIAHKLVPALDTVGAPCMFDLATKTPYYNRGAGDFSYPGKETTATTYSLRRPRMYAQKTEHGIRRLYHVPKGYNGTPEEYAVENGFKVLVETPAPEEGYWAPVWHDREDCIELEWVETEPPAEEELLTEA